MKKKLSLLTALGLSCALLFTACTPKSSFTPPECDSGVQSAYEADVISGNSGKDYNTWLKDFVNYHSEGKKTTKLNTVDGGDLQLVFEDGTSVTVSMPRLFTVYTVDEDGAPVAGAHVGIYSGSNSFVMNDVVSDASGIAKAAFKPKKNTVYYVTASRTVDQHTPSGYAPKDYNTAFESDNTVRYIYRNLSNSNSYFDREHVAFPYSRIYSATAEEPTEEGGTQLIYKSSGFKTAQNYNSGDPDVTASNWTTSPDGLESKAELNVAYKGGKVKYFYFAPHVAARTNGASAETDEKIISASVAACGIYRINVETSGDVRLYFFDEINTPASADENGVPLFSNVYGITGTAPASAVDPAVAALYSGSDSIYLHVYRNQDTTGIGRGDFGNSTAPFFFYVRGSQDANVKISVERVHDAVMSTLTAETVSDSVRPAPAGDEPWGGNTANAAPTEMAINGSLQPVYSDPAEGGDGYYHVQSKTGPILLVQLNKAVSRVSTEALIDMPKNAPNGPGVFEFTVREFTDVDPATLGGITGIRKESVSSYDYNAMLTAYSDAAKDYNGYYGVTREMRDLLVNYGGGMAASNAKEGYAWLSPCYYYQPEGGIPLDGSGTELDPYLMNLGDNTAHFTGGMESAQLKFTASETAYYAFTCEATYTCSKTTSTVENEHFFLLHADESVIFTVQKGAESSALISLRQIDSYVMVGEFEPDDQGLQINKTVGSSAQYAYSFPLVTPYVVFTVDTVLSENGIYVTYKCNNVFPNIPDNYVIQVIGGTATYKGTTESELVISLKKNDTLTFLVQSTDMNDGDLPLVYIYTDNTATPNVTL